MARVDCRGDGATTPLVATLLMLMVVLASATVVHVHAQSLRMPSSAEGVMFQAGLARAPDGAPYFAILNVVGSPFGPPKPFGGTFTNLSVFLVSPDARVLDVTLVPGDSGVVPVGGRFYVYVDADEEAWATTSLLQARDGSSAVAEGAWRLSLGDSYHGRVVHEQVFILN